MTNIILAGVGGQGTVLASKLIAQCAINRGQSARTAETIGMAQRGGSVFSHVRIGDDILSPLIPLAGADLIIGFEPAEAVRVLPYLKPDGAMVVSTYPIKPVSDSLAKTSYRAEEMVSYLRSRVKTVVTLDAIAVCAASGSVKALNIALLGAAAACGLLGVSLDELRLAIEQKIAPRFQAVNIQALVLAAATIGSSGDH